MSREEHRLAKPSRNVDKMLSQFRQICVPFKSIVSIKSEDNRSLTSGSVLNCLTIQYAREEKEKGKLKLKKVSFANCFT